MINRMLSVEYPNMKMLNDIFFLLDNQCEENWENDNTKTT